MIVLVIICDLLHFCCSSAFLISGKQVFDFIQQALLIYIHVFFLIMPYLYYPLNQSMLKQKYCVLVANVPLKLTLTFGIQYSDWTE